MKTTAINVTVATVLFCIGWFGGRVSEDSDVDIQIQDSAGESPNRIRGSDGPQGATPAEVQRMINAALAERSSLALNGNAPAQSSDGTDSLDDAEADGDAEEQGNVEIPAAEMLAQLDAVLEAEGVDETWAYDAERRLEGVVSEALDGAVGGARLDEVTCGTTFCRARVVSETGEAYDAVYSALMSGRLVWREGGGSLVRSEDESQTHLYLSRAGRELPVLVPPDSAI